MKKMPQEAVECFRDGLFDDEESIVEAIKDFLATEKDWDVLREHHLSIQDVLNGRFNGTKQRKAVEGVFSRWNKILGFNNFKV